MRCSLHPQEAPFFPLPVALAELGRSQVSGLCVFAMDTVTPAPAASLVHSEVQRGLRVLFHLPNFELHEG